jgi:hypothetical protein
MGPILSYTTDEWHAFLADVKHGDFDELGERSKSSIAVTDGY